MNILQVIYIIISTYFLSFGIFFLAEVIFVYKRIDKYFYFSLACIFGSLYVLCTSLLATTEFFDYALLVHRVKFVALLWAAAFWILSTFNIFFNKSRFNKIALSYSFVWSLFTIFSNNFFHLPIKMISVKPFKTTIVYLHSTPGFLYPICIVGIILLFIYTMYRIIKSNETINKKITGIIIISPAIIGGIHDGLVLQGHLDNLLILEFIVFIFLIGTFSIFFTEKRKRLLRIENINKELEEKVESKTIQLSKANKEMWVNYKKLKQAEKLKKEMLQIAAHDLKSPLQGIVSYSELMMVQFNENKTLIKRLKKILNSADDMLKIIQNLLKQEAKKAGEHFVNPTECNVSNIVEYVVDRNYPKIIAKNQQLLTEIEKDCLIISDNDKILEIIDNLISNAIKYTFPKGTISISLKKINEKVVFKVKDTGQGLTGNDKQLLFKKFVRLSAKPTGNEKSTGLGLYIVKKFIDLLNGKIEVNSEHGKGSEFIVELSNFQQ